MKMLLSKRETKHVYPLPDSPGFLLFSEVIDGSMVIVTIAVNHGEQPDPCTVHKRMINALPIKDSAESSLIIFKELCRLASRYISLVKPWSVISCSICCIDSTSLFQALHRSRPSHPSQVSESSGHPSQRIVQDHHAYIVYSSIQACRLQVC